jgi:hypothetical protein
VFTAGLRSRRTPGEPRVKATSRSSGDPEIFGGRRAANGHEFELDVLALVE